MTIDERIWAYLLMETKYNNGKLQDWVIKNEL